MGNPKKLPIRSTLYFKCFMFAFLNLVTCIIQELNRWKFEYFIPFQYVATRQPINYDDPPVTLGESCAEVRPSISFFNICISLSK
jgi:hypothetical protein